jgi:TolB protein
VAYAPVAAGGELPPTGLIVFQAGGAGGASDLYLIGSDGRGRTQLTNTPVNEFDPAWSPDGRRLIFVRDGANSRQLVIMDLDSRLETILPTPGVSVHGHPDWSPDGTRIVFDNQRGAYREIYVVGVDGSGMKNLTETLLPDENSPVWSPDGTRIAYIDEGQLAVMDADGGNAGPLGIGNTPARRPDWSPDGQFILYDTTDIYGLREDIHVVTADTGALTDGINHARHGRWSADGLRVVFAGEGGGIFHMDLDTYNLIVVQDSPFGDMPAWQPN